MVPIIIIILIFLLIFFAPATIVTFPDFRYYRKVYKTLPDRTFYRNGTQVYSHKNWKQDDGFVWFTKKNEFRLIGDHYLHNADFTYFSPYAFFWLRKYQKWFRENVDIDKIEKF